MTISAQLVDNDLKFIASYQTIEVIIFVPQSLHIESTWYALIHL